MIRHQNVGVGGRAWSGRWGGTDERAGCGGGGEGTDWLVRL